MDNGEGNSRRRRKKGDCDEDTEREGEEKGEDFLLCHEKFITPNLSPENCVSIIEIFTWT